jgi:hypothetical protein
VKDKAKAAAEVVDAVKEPGWKRPGYDIDPTFRIRPVDQWRTFAAQPLPDKMHLRREHEPPPPTPLQVQLPLPALPPPPTPPTPIVWVLEEDGKEIGRWKDDDLPWLEPYLQLRILQLFGAWQIAQTQLEHVRDNQDGGTENAKQKKKEALRQLELDLDEANKLLSADRSLSVAEIAGRIARGRNVDHLRGKFKKRGGKIVAKYVVEPSAPTNGVAIVVSKVQQSAPH